MTTENFVAELKRLQQIPEHEAEASFYLSAFAEGCDFVELVKTKTGTGSGSGVLRIAQTPVSDEQLEKLEIKNCSVFINSAHAEVQDD